MDLERSSSSSRTAYLSVKKQSTSTTTTTTTTTNSNSNNIMEDHHDEKRRSNKRCCLVSLAVLIGIALLLSILGATVFKARRPITTVKSVSIQNMDLSFDPLGMKVHLNLSLDADVSVKNPNRVGFKFTDSSAYLNYKGQVVGQAPIPANQIGPGQTLSMNLILTVMADRFLSNSQAVISDLLSGTLPLSTNTRISGKVTVLFVKVHVVSYANCNLNITVASRSLANSDSAHLYLKGADFLYPFHILSSSMALDAVEENGGDGNGTLATPRKQKHSKHRQWCKAVTIALALLLILLVLLGVVLALTVFKIKEPRTQITSVSLEGIAPRVSIFPAINIQLNVTLNLTLNIQNPNHASFKSALGQGVLLYRGDQVGDAQLNPGLIPAMGNATLFCLLTVQVDRLIQPGLTSLFSDIMAGQLAVETKTRIPGKVSFLGILRKHIVSTSDCQIVIGFPDLSIRSQDCQQHTKL